jgi:hypothetical protein
MTANIFNLEYEILIFTIRGRKAMIYSDLATLKKVETRCIFLSKTENTEFNKYCLPLSNVSLLITDDLILKPDK